MARVTPSQVVAFIDRMIPDGMKQPAEAIRAWRFSHTHFTQLVALVDMVDQIPPELMPAEASKYAGTS